MSVKRYENIICLLTALMLSAIYIFETSNLFQMILFGLAMVMLVVTIMYNRGKVIIHVSSIHYFMIVFIAYSAATYLWSIDSSNTLGQVKVLLKLFLLVIMIYPCFEKLGNTDKMLKAIMISGYIVSIYSIIYFGVYYSISMFITARRLSSSVMNVNGLGIIAALSLLISFYFFRNGERRIILLGSIPDFMLVLLSGSKKAFFVLFVGLAIYLLIDAFRSGSFSLKFAKTLGVIILVFSGVMLISKLTVFSGVLDRFSRYIGRGETDNSSILRKQMIVIAMKNFWAHPILGTGIGSSNSVLSSSIGYNAYYHNNFVELLSCGGIVGFLIYYLMTYSYFLWKLFHNRESKYCTIMLTLVIVLLCSDYGMVSYYSKDIYVLFAILFSYCGNNHYI